MNEDRLNEARRELVRAKGTLADNGHYLGLVSRLENVIVDENELGFLANTREHIEGYEGIFRGNVTRKEERVIFEEGSVRSGNYLENDSSRNSLRMIAYCSFVGCSFALLGFIIFQQEGFILLNRANN